MEHKGLNLKVSDACYQSGYLVIRLCSVMYLCKNKAKGV